MAITHTSRNGKVYYLHTGPKRGGGVQHFFSIKSSGNLASKLPEGFEIYESVEGQVFLRRQQPKLIRDEEVDCIARNLEEPRAGRRYKIEVRRKILTIYESEARSDLAHCFGLPLSQKQREVMAERFAHYQAVLRFVLTDSKLRLFAPERFCFRGSVDDWIPIGQAEPIQKLATRYLKHLGRDSMYELF